GNYWFSNWTAGVYTVQVILPSGYAFAPQYQGSDATLDSNVDSSGNAAVDASSGLPDLSIDAGLVPLIGDLVWFDSNVNGIQDVGESGAAGVTVTLYDASSTAFPTRLSSDLGNYWFSNWTAGLYTVQVTLPIGYAFALQGQGSDATVDSNM